MRRDAIWTLGIVGATLLTGALVAAFPHCEYTEYIPAAQMHVSSQKGYLFLATALHENRLRKSLGSPAAKREWDAMRYQYVHIDWGRMFYRVALVAWVGLAALLVRRFAIRERTRGRWRLFVKLCGWLTALSIILSVLAGMAWGLTERSEGMNPVIGISPLANFILGLVMSVVLGIGWTLVAGLPISAVVALSLPQRPDQCTGAAQS